MAQKLVTLPSPSSPVVITQSKTLVADMAAVENLTKVELKAIAILGMIYSLASIFGKPNFKADHAGLIQDSITFMGGISLLDDTDTNKQFTAILAVISWSGGNAADPTLSADVNTLLKEARDFIALPEETLNRIFLTLLYGLSI